MCGVCSPPGLEALTQTTQHTRNAAERAQTSMITSQATARRPAGARLRGTAAAGQRRPAAPSQSSRSPLTPRGQAGRERAQAGLGASVAPSSGGCPTVTFRGSAGSSLRVSTPASFTRSYSQSNAGSPVGSLAVRDRKECRQTAPRPPREKQGPGGRGCALAVGGANTLHHVMSPSSNQTFQSPPVSGPCPSPPTASRVIT